MIDIIIIVVFAFRLFVGKKLGIIGELISIPGMLIATFCALHYYSRFAKFLEGVVFIKTLPVEMIAVVLIVLVVMLLFYLMQEALGTTIRLDSSKTINQNIGILLASVNAFLLAGLIFFSALLVKNEVFFKSVESSLTGRIYKNISLKIYVVGYKHIFKPVFPDKKMNLRALAAVDRLKKPL